MISAFGTLVCMLGLAFGVFGMIAPKKLLGYRKAIMRIDGPSRFFDSSLWLERVSCFGIALLCGIGLAKILAR